MNNKGGGVKSTSGYFQERPRVEWRCSTNWVKPEESPAVGPTERIKRTNFPWS